MAHDGSESIADVLEALVAAGLGSVETKPGMTESGSPDQDAIMSSFPFGPVGFARAFTHSSLTGVSGVPCY